MSKPQEPAIPYVLILDVEWLLAWFPIKASASLTQAKMRGGVFGHKNTDNVFVSGNREVHFLGQGAADGDPMEHDNRVGAFIDVGLAEADNQTFDVKVEVFNGSFRREKHFVLHEDVTAPFMINVQFRGDDRLLGDTIITLQGVFEVHPPTLFGG